MLTPLRDQLLRRQASIVQFIKFGIVGVIGFVVDAGVLTLCMQSFGMGPYEGRGVSFLIAVTTTWLCNRLFTFRGHESGDTLARQWAKFAVVGCGGFALNYGKIGRASCRERV